MSFHRSSSLQSSRYINNRFVTTSDVLASNGIIHVLQGPLEAPPPRPEVSDAITTEMSLTADYSNCFHLCPLTFDWLCRCMWVIRRGWASACCCWSFWWRESSLLDTTSTPTTPNPSSSTTSRSDCSLLQFCCFLHTVSLQCGADM